MNHSIHDKIKPIQVYLEPLEDDFRKRKPYPDFPISSLPLFNRKVWGLREGLTIIGGRPSNGKSSLAMQIAYDLATQQIPVLFCSLEMTVESILERLFCHTMKIDNYELLTGKFHSYTSHWEKFIKQLEGIPLLITCDIGKTFKELNETIRILEKDFKPQCVIVDYIQAIRIKEAKNRQMIDDYINEFKELTIKKKFRGILCSQIHRPNPKEIGKIKPPTLHSLKESGGLEEAADVALLLHYSGHYDHSSEKENKIQIEVAKMRNGRTGVSHLFFHPQWYLFSETKIEKEKESEQLGF